MFIVDSIILFFVIGIFIKLFAPQFHIPSYAYQAVSIYLLLVIGLKGGIALRQDCSWFLLVQSLFVCVLALSTMFVSLAIMKYICKYTYTNAIAVASHYGSVSVGTFAVAMKFLKYKGIPFEAYVTLFVALMEFPSIIMAQVLLQQNHRSNRQSFTDIVRSVFMHKSILILCGGIICGFAVGLQIKSFLDIVLLDWFRYVLALFLVEMGLSVGEQISEIKKNVSIIVMSSIATSIICSFLGMGAGIIMGLSAGGTFIVMVLASSASYIAVPAVLKSCVPRSTIGLCMSHSLGVTFPFNILIGMSLYWFMLGLVY
jgi:hypothetical protein